MELLRKGRNYFRFLPHPEVAPTVEKKTNINKEIAEHTWHSQLELDLISENYRLLFLHTKPLQERGFPKMEEVTQRVAMSFVLKIPFFRTTSYHF